MNIPNGNLSRSDASSDAFLFSSSLPVLPNQNLDEIASGLNQFNGEIINNMIDDDGDLHLPDDEEELLAGLMDDLNFSTLPDTFNDLEDYDLFSSGGGFELETDSLNKSFPRMGSIAGEHPYGEHPSRTLFVRNINSNVEDSELQALFEQYGDIRTMYTACKHRGFVMISYYDIRASKAAMRALQSKILKRRKLDIHFSIPKDNPSEKDVNQGTLVVFNLAPSVSNNDLESIFGTFGEIKEIRETPNKRHHKFVEFFDARSADAALKALNKTELAGNRIKLEHSRPGGTRRNMMLQLNPELEQDDFRSYLNHVESPLATSPAGNYWCNSTVNHSPIQSLSKSPIFGNLSLTMAASANNYQGRTIGDLDHLFLNSSYNSANPKASAFHQKQSFGSVSSFGSLNSSHSSSVWPVNPLSSKGKTQKFPYSAQDRSLHQHHHVGSAPSGFFPRSTETSSTSSMPFQGPKHSKLFTGNGTQPRPGTTIAASIDCSSKFQLDLSKIMSGDDLRTTLMIKNIPNKYTRKMLLAAIDDKSIGTYDFLYLPIDFKNKCNVGYAFINMVSPKYIIGLYEAFNGKKWDKFNSEKVASLAYARIQGKTALIAHFQNSSLMNEDSLCHPIVFDGSESSYPVKQSSVNCSYITTRKQTIYD